MFRKLLCVVLISLTITLSLSKRSFTVLLDTTLSMEDEIDVIKANIGSVLNLFGNSSDMGNYILVPFNDPDVGPPLYANTPDGLLTALNALTINGGDDCPENSVAGIEKALEVSNPDSYVFVFTDAYAKDNRKFSAIENLCRRTRSQVYLFLSGICLPSGSVQGGRDVYFNVAHTCAGAVLEMEQHELRQAFKFMKEIIKVDWNGVIDHENFTDYIQLTFSLDSFTTDLIIAVNGAYPSVQIQDRNGRSPGTEKIIDAGHSQVVRITISTPGEYKVSIRCEGYALASFFMRSELPFLYGFSTKYPHTVKETSHRPIPGRSNYILIATKTATIEINSIELHVLNENDIKILTIAGHDKANGLYVANSFFVPDKDFRISISGQDTSAHKGFTVLTKMMKPQESVRETQRTKPSVEIIKLQPTTVEFGKHVNIACRVTGYPKPNIEWNDENETNISSVDDLIEIPDVHISYVFIEHLDKNTTISCKASNTEGEHSQKIALFVNTPFVFDVIQIPRDASFEFGTQGHLYCEVKSYPKANTKWYHNDTFLEPFENIQIVPEDNVLLIKNVSMIDTGEYKCEVANEMRSRTFIARVSVSGLETPEIDFRDSAITLSPGDWTDIDCNIVKGKPVPDITWKHKTATEFFFKEVPDGVYTEQNKLKIPVAKLEYGGVYRCEAINILGQAYRDITVKIQYAPKIRNSDPQTIMIREGEIVELECEVDAIPAAIVRWEMSQDDVIMPFEDRHRTDDHHTHRFEALWKDSGDYHCIAENDIGKAQKSIKVNVLVPPYIQPPDSSAVSVQAGANVRFTCRVSFGNPVPTTQWEFIDLDSNTTILSRGNSSNTLQLTNITRRHEGAYLCLANNIVGSDSITIYLKVQ